MPYLRARDAARAGLEWEMVRPDGTTTPVPDGGLAAFAPMGEGVVGISADGERPTAVLLDGRGTPIRTAATRGYALAVSPGGRIVGWLGTSGSPHVIEAGGSRQFDMPAVRQGSEIAAISGTRTCRENPPDYGCSVWVNTADASGSWVSTSHGIVEAVPSIKAVRDVSEAGHVMGLASLADDGSCSGIWKNYRRPVWQTCDYTLTQFSPGSGWRVLGTDPYLDGLGQRTLAFIDADQGEVVTEFESPRNGPTIIQTAWEDDRHVLAVVVDGTQWSVLRLGDDGSMEYAVAPVAGDEVSRPYVLPAG